VKRSDIPRRLDIPAGLRGRPGLFVLAIAAALCVYAPADADAQVRRGRTVAPPPPWMPVTVGVRGGWEQEQLASGATFGAEVHIPIVRDGAIEVVPSFDAIFLRGFATEYQYNLDAVFVPGRRRGGVFIGGGVGWRRSLIAGVGQEFGRQTYFGYNIVLGAKNQVGPLQILLGLKWALLTDTEYDPSAISLGIQFPLWRAGPPRR
jgi:hypothetical protein